MITTKNYFNQISSLDWSTMPEALAKGHKLVQGAAQNDWSAYQSNETIRRVVEAYFQKLSEYLDKNPSQAKQEKKPVPKGKSQSKVITPAKPAKGNSAGLKVEIRPYSTRSSKFIVWDVSADQIFANEKFDSIEEAQAFIEQNALVLVKTATPDGESEEHDAELVERIDTDVQFIRRYANMNGKVKSQAQILSLITSLQRAILERRIRKDSPYAADIALMQEQLINAYEKMGDMAEIKIAPKNLKRYLQIAGSQENMLSITLLKAYVGLHGKRGVKDKAQRLLDRMKKAVVSKRVSISDKYASRLNSAFENLQAYVSGDSEVMTIARAELNGLRGITGEDLFSQKKNPDLSTGDDEDESGPLVVPSAELLGMEFETIGLKGKYRELIGDPSVGFSAMVYGLPKSGKSTLCLDFAKHLAEHHGKVLYCAVEEGFGYTLKEKIERLKASHPRLYITDRIPPDVGEFQFVFIDSVSKAGMDIADLDALRKSHPETSFIFIYHTTKQGRFKGVNTHAHEVDVIIEVGKGEAKATGRFNVGESMQIGIFEPMYDVKNFTALIAFNDDLRNLYYDMAEARGIESSWDVYHIQEGTETPSDQEQQIMKEIYTSRIRFNPELLAEFEVAAKDFRRNVELRNEKRRMR